MGRIAKTLDFSIAMAEDHRALPNDFGINRESLSRELLARGLTQNEFCRRTGITTNTLARINKGLPVRGDTIGKIARALAEIEKIEGIEDLLEPQEVQPA